MFDAIFSFIDAQELKIQGAGQEGFLRGVLWFWGLKEVGDLLGFYWIFINKFFENFWVGPVFNSQSWAVAENPGLEDTWGFRQNLKVKILWHFCDIFFKKKPGDEVPHIILPFSLCASLIFFLTKNCNYRLQQNLSKFLELPGRSFNVFQILNLLFIKCTNDKMASAFLLTILPS